jgi:hypothetical protein
VARSDREVVRSPGVRPIADRPEPSADRGAGGDPQNVRTAEERRRWRLAEAIAAALFTDAGAAAVLMAAGVIYRSEIPTD